MSDWTDIIIAVIAAAGGFLGSVVSNNKQVAVLSTKLDGVKEELKRQGERIDAHNHLNERLTAVEITLKERERHERANC